MSYRKNLDGNDRDLFVAARKVAIFSDYAAIEDEDCILYAKFIDMCGIVVTITCHHNK
jgi:hypothetical protein